MKVTEKITANVAETRKVAERRLSQLSARGREIGLDLKDAGRQAWLAGLGAVAVAGEGGSELFETLVERGGERRRAVRRAAASRVETVRERARAAAARVGEKVDAGAAATLRRFGVPSREEVLTLSDRIAQLTRKVESLAARG